MIDILAKPIVPKHLTAHIVPSPGTTLAQAMSLRNDVMDEEGYTRNKGSETIRRHDVVHLILGWLGIWPSDHTRANEMLVTDIFCIESLNTSDAYKLEQQSRKSLLSRLQRFPSVRANLNYSAYELDSLSARYPLINSFLDSGIDNNGLIQLIMDMDSAYRFTKSDCAAAVVVVAAMRDELFFNSAEEVSFRPRIIGDGFISFAENVDATEVFKYLHKISRQITSGELDDKYKGMKEARMSLFRKDLGLLLVNGWEFEDAINYLNVSMFEFEEEDLSAIRGCIQEMIEQGELIEKIYISSNREYKFLLPTEYAEAAY